MRQGRSAERERDSRKSPSFTPNSENGNWGVELVIFIFNKYFTEIFKKPLYVRHFLCLNGLWALLVAQMVKNLPAMQETLV